MAKGESVFKTTKAFSSFSVDDLGRARKFYGDTLGLEIEESPEGLELNIGDGSHVFVYPKGNHVPATFTILNFPVESVEDAVGDLTHRGVRFEVYESGELKTDKRGIFTESAGPKIAWFKDPAGNFLSVLEANR